MSQAQPDLPDWPFHPASGPICFKLGVQHKKLSADFPP